MSAETVAQRYASALYSKAVDSKELDVVSDNINALYEACKIDEVSSLLKSPISSKEDKTNALSAIFKSFSPLVLGFIKLTIDKKREDVLMDICRKFIDIDNGKNAVISAQVKSASQLDKATLTKIEDLIKSKSNAKKVRLTHSVDENLIGGLQIEYNNMLLDTSIATQLTKLKKELNIA